MKKNKFLGCLAALTITLHASAQLDWNTAGNNITGFEWFGADGTSTIPLRIRHDADQPIEWYTNAIRRMYLQQDLSYQIGSFPGQDKFGHLLLSPDADVFFSNLTNARGPFTLLHLAAATDNAQEVSYRPWMNTGITFTGNADHGYVGQKAGELDYTDMVIHWSDNPGETLKDRMRFIFTSGFNSAASGAESEEGLEFMRMWPNRYEDPHIGVGDFYAANLVDANITEPTERLDMVNGRLRIRDLPEASGEATGTYKVMVVDDTAYPSDERGVVKWATLPTPTAGDDCDWELDETTNRLWTATAPIGTNDDCPEKDWLVGIGTSAMAFKLDVRHSDADAVVSGAVQAYLQAGSTSGATAMWAEVAPIGSGTVDSPTGVRGRVTGVDYIGKGVVGEATALPSDGSVSKVIGTEGLATGPGTGTLTDGWGSSGKVVATNGGTITFATGALGEVLCNGAVTYGTAVEGIITGEGTSSVRHGLRGLVYGEDVTGTTYGARVFANGGTTINYGLHAEAGGTNAYAGYFVGNTHVQGNLTVSGTYPSSDAMLKTDVQSMENPMAIIADLQPKRYTFLSEQYPQLALPAGEHMGFIAQEVQTVLPGIVKSFHQAARMDSTGAEIAPSFDYLGVNYTEIIPLLVAGMQQQQTQLAQLQEQLAACCANPDGSDLRSGSAVDDEKLTPAQERLLRIAPNPFTDRATLFCTLERAGRMQLMANSADGRSLMVLSEGQREAGEFQHEWRTENMAPGVYYITLLLDGEPVVKRAVKVGR